MKKEKAYKDIKIESLPESRVKIIGEVEAAHFDKARTAVIKSAVETAELPGFRIGKAPEAMVLKHLGEAKILERAAEAVLNEIYGDILEEHKVRAIGMPAITITKIATENPLGFIMETAVLPEVSLENYKKLATEASKSIPDAPTTAEEKEIEKVVEDLRKHMAEPATEEGSASENSGETKKEPNLPEMNDEFAKKFGDFATVADLKKKIGENLLEQKKHEVKDKRRAAIADKLVAQTKFDVPNEIIESELGTMLGQFQADIERHGLTFEGYLKQINKTTEEIQKEWRESAIKRAKLELILKHIGRKENIAPKEEEIKKEVDHLMSHHKDADRFKARMYVENLMTNQMVFDWLEN